MKKLTFLLISLFAYLTVFAGEVTEQQALQKAQNFFKDKKLQSKNLRRAPRAGQQQSTSQEDYYVFNVENNGGFVIISGDDRTPEVLGYDDSGNIDMDNLPPNLKEWLGEYSKQMKVIQTSGNNVRRTASRAPKVAIEPLITTQWGQGSPYNHQCPEIDGKHCVTGCVATAMAQVMYYHKWPQEACAAIPEYTTVTRQIEMPALPAKTFNWSVMRNRYWEGEQGESADAVAELMRYCGQAVEMNYNVDESGAFEMPRHLIQYFGYSKNAKYVTMSQYTMSQWEDILYKELSEGRPMLYGGANLTSAHEFICDGYDGDGYYHFNWGWDGDANGFFLLSVMFNEEFYGGFVYDQAAIIGLQPDNGESANPYVYSFLGGDLAQTEYMRSSTSENFSNISLTEGVYIQYEIAENRDVSIEYGLGIYKDTQLLTILDQSSAILSFNSNNVSKQTNVAFGRNLEDGVYQIRSIYKFAGNNDWEACADSYVNYIVATISTNSLTLRKISKTGTENATYTVNSISILGNIATVNLTNSGSTNQEMLFIWTRPESGGLAFMDSSCGAIEAGKSGNVVFPVHFGVENVSILITADPSGSRVMWEGTVLCQEKVEQKLKCSNLSIDNFNNGVLKASEAHITFSITNLGDNIYNDVIGCDIQMFNNSEEGWSSKVNRITQPILINIGETKDVDFVIPHLENNRIYNVYFHYYGKLMNSFEFSNDFSPISFMVAKNYVESDGLYYSYSPESKTASVIPENYQNIESVTIPPTITVEGLAYSVTEIAPNTFKGCHFQTLSLPEGLLSIGRNAFMSCDIKSINLPSSLKTIGQQAFSGSIGLKEIKIPEGTSTIRMGAFEFCKDLEVLRLPSTLKLIEECIIWGSENLTAVFSAILSPIEIPEGTFITAKYINGQITQVSQSATLYVPKGSVSKYQEAAGWNVFTRITDKLPYKLTYYVDGEIYKSYMVEEETTITAETEPTKEGYTFSGWSEIPETMPDHDVTVTGTFELLPDEKYALNGHEYIDLGLTSGKYWSTMNYGAGNPEDTGSYLTDSESGSVASFWGISWKTPTKEEMQELIDECEWTWTELNNVAGYSIQGPNGNTMFLPAANYLTSSKDNQESQTWVLQASSLDKALISGLLTSDNYPIRPISTNDVEVNEANFPDENFRNWILNNVEAAKDGVLTSEEIKAIYEINCSEQNICDLKGIEFFTSLNTLFCNDNKLSYLDLSCNPELLYLSCWNNQLTSIDISNNFLLTDISCQNNRLASLDVSHNPALDWLNCRDNQLRNLNISRNAILTQLLCDDNQLSSLDVSYNTELRGLGCRNNLLTSLDVSTNTELYGLACSNNKLTSLDVSNNLKLDQLACDNNQLTSLDIESNTLLSFLDCNNNQLTSLDVSKNAQIFILRCTGNQLTSLDVSNVASLTLLFCYENKLTSLILDNDLLTDIYCRNNLLTSLDLRKCPLLRRIEGANNQFISVNVSKNTELDLLDLSNNNLHALDVSNNVKLTELAVGGNLLTSLDISKNKELTILNCAKNPLTSLDLTNNRELINLYCYGISDEDRIKLSSLGISPLIYGLQELDVSKNTKLQRLSCYENKLFDLDLSQNTLLSGVESSPQILMGVVLKLPEGLALKVPSTFDLSKVTNIQLNGEEVTGSVVTNYGLKYFVFADKGTDRSAIDGKTLSYSYDTSNSTAGQMTVQASLSYTNIANIHYLVYMVDGEVDKIYTLYEGDNIILEAVPTKFGYTFSGWSEIPETMPDHDVIVTGTFEEHFDVSHVVTMVNCIMNVNITAEEIAYYDMNGDAELNIGDVILIVKSILNNSGSAAIPAFRRAPGRVDFAQYCAAQFELKVDKNTSIKDICLVGKMAQTHQLMYQKKDDDTYAVVIYSMSNQLMSPENGQIIEIGAYGGDVTMQNIVVATPSGETYCYLNDGTITGIRELSNSVKSAEVYDLKGNRLDGKGLKKGLYIINGKKAVIK